MSNQGSVTHWIAELKAGDEIAAQRLWERYFSRLVALARKRLPVSRRRAADEEDVAQDALLSFFDRAAKGRFPQLRDRDSLWPLLVVITARKSTDQVRRDKAKKRGGGRVWGESIVDMVQSNKEIHGMAQIVGDSPTPQFEAQLLEEYQKLIDSLNSESLKEVARCKFQGFTNKEIASTLGCALRTVERKMEIIRRRLSVTLAE